MTYVLGLRRRGVAAIFTDSLLCDDRNEPSSYASLKGGILFPGCIFGASGDWCGTDAALQFVVTAQEAARNVHNIQEAWELFEKVCRLFKTGDRKFEVLLSSRHLGEPSFFLYTSDGKRLIAGEQDVYMLGSGKQLYEAELSNLQTYLTFLDQVGCPSDAAFYLVRSWLSLLLHSKPQLASRHGVGGVFTFFMQNASTERPQRPTMDVLIYPSPNEKTFSATKRRVAFAKHQLLGDLLVIISKDQSGTERDGVIVQRRYRDITLKVGGQIYRDLSGVLDTHRLRPPYFFMSMQVVGDKFRPGIHFAERSTVLADLTDYIEPTAANNVLAAYELGERGELLYLFNTQEGRRWQPPSPRPNTEDKWIAAEFVD